MDTKVVDKNSVERLIEALDCPLAEGETMAGRWELVQSLVADGYVHREMTLWEKIKVAFGYKLPDIEIEWKR